MQQTNGVHPKLAQQQLKPPSRMTLAGVVKGRIQPPYRIVGYAPEGTGKTTFAASAPSPIFLPTEDGTAHVDVARFPRPENLADVLDAIRVLTTTDHEYKTFVVDTLDHLEPLIWAEVCRRDGVGLIEEVGGGYGKGYTAAIDEWRKVLAALETLQRTKQMHVILLAHSHIKTFRNPEGEDFDRYQLKLHDKAAGLVKEWSEEVLFMRQETLVHKEKHKKAKGVGTGARVIYTERTAAFDAKNRHSLPSELPLSWEDFDAAAKAGQVADPAALRAEIFRKAKQLGAEFERLVDETVTKAGDDTQQLARINNRVNVKLAELEPAVDSAAVDATGKGN
jgi:hypothetical protein